MCCTLKRETMNSPVFWLLYLLPEVRGATYGHGEYGMTFKFLNNILILLVLLFILIDSKS